MGASVPSGFSSEDEQGERLHHQLPTRVKVLSVSSHVGSVGNEFPTLSLLQLSD